MEYPEYFELGKISMESLLATFEVVDDPGYNKKSYALAIPKSHPALIARGSNSLVFELPQIYTPEGMKYLVGKGFKYTEASTWEGVPEDELHLIGCRSGLTPDMYGLETTIYWLHQMNLEVQLPDIKEFCQYFGKKRIQYTIMPDLRENGKYSVIELEDKDNKPCINYNDLITMRDITCQKILEKTNELSLEICPAGHGSEEDLIPTLQHMFLVQYDKHESKLVLGDLNHLAIHEIGRQFGIKPEYLEK